MLLQNIDVVHEDLHVQADVTSDLLQRVKSIQVPDLLSSLLKQLSHDETWPDFRVLHHHVLDEHHDLCLQKAPVINFQLMVMHHFEVLHPLIQTNLIIPFESHVDRTAALPGHPLIWVVKEPIAKPGLITQMAAQTEKHELAASVLLLVNSEHDPIGVPQLTVSVYSVEYTCECFREMPKVVGEARVGRSSLLFKREHSTVKLVI